MVWSLFLLLNYWSIKVFKVSNHFYEANRVLKKAIIKISRRKVTAKYQSKYFNNFRSPSRDTGKIIRSLFCFSDQTDIFYLKELEEGRRESKWRLCGHCRDSYTFKKFSHPHFNNSGHTALCS